LQIPFVAELAGSHREPFNPISLSPACFLVRYRVFKMDSVVLQRNLYYEPKDVRDRSLLKKPSAENFSVMGIEVSCKIK